MFSDCQPAIQRARSDQPGPGQCWARAIIEEASRLVARGNTLTSGGPQPTGGSRETRPRTAWLRRRREGSFLHDRMSGPQRLDSDECWWCKDGRRQSRHHLFVECKSWTPQIRTLWQRVGKDCGWEHPRAPALRWLWKDDAVGAVVEFLESTKVGSRASVELARARVGEDRDGEGVPGQERGGWAGPALGGCTFRCLFFSFCFLDILSFVWRIGEVGD